MEKKAGGLIHSAVDLQEWCGTCEVSGGLPFYPTHLFMSLLFKAGKGMVVAAYMTSVVQDSNAVEVVIRMVVFK